VRPISVQRAHVFAGPTVRRTERVVARPLAPQRAPFASTRDQFEPRRRAPQKSGLERWVLYAGAGLLVAGAASCLFLLQGNWRSPLAVVAPAAVVSPVKSDARAAMMDARTDLFAGGGRDLTGAIDRSAYVRTSSRPVLAVDDADSPAAVVARRWQGYLAEVLGPAPSEPRIRLASLESPPPRSVIRTAFPPDRSIPRIPLDGNSKTALVDFATAPFPYEGNMPGSERPFLDAGEAGHRGHTNFRGHVLWESETFNDPRVLLHIPPAFDPTKPGVMIVFFHGHGANLARDVRDRQQVPAQISASGMNAVLVAPQFAFNAADSSAGKFWEPGGFKRFLDEAARQLAALDGDPRSASSFANMPIVIVAYSGGYGPTLSVLDRGGVNARIRGIVLLDALYTGMGRFASWIASNRSGFFISSFTPHNHGRNVELEEMLNERSIGYESELRRHLPGSVAIISAGDISHRDFVNRAWADSPLKDILVRLDGLAPRVDVAGPAPASSPLAAASAPRHD
jgi:hypothetical protein